MSKMKKELPNPEKNFEIFGNYFEKHKGIYKIEMV
jgi:hypothetical protein